jgi:pyruvate dehydrogenase E2 component (dihydrolipoyllysine-residue acetyltransferase)
MSIEVRLPELGESVTHAKLTAWLKREGDRVSAGEPIAEVETDKTNVEIEAPAAGVLETIHVRAGTDRVPVNELLALIADRAPGDQTGSVDAMSRSGGPERERSSGPTLLKPDPTPERDRPRPALAAKERPAVVPGVEGLDSSQSAIPASPLATRMAYAAGLSLADIPGSGPGGRITKNDVDAVLGPPNHAQVAVSSPVAVPRLVEDSAAYDVRPMSPMRRVTAERLLHAKQTIPHFYLQTDCAVDQVSRIRQELNARGDEKFSVTIFVIRAVALALQKVPAANSTWVDGAVRVYHSADIALAINTPSGLIAPVIRQVEQKSLLMIAHEVRALSERARAGRLKPEEYAGGTFTISNLGMYGVTSIYPIINPPQSCILGVGAVEERPVVRDHAVGVGSMMTCTLSADHRAIDGATGAEFLAAFRQLIEDPWGLVL